MKQVLALFGQLLQQKDLPTNFIKNQQVGSDKFKVILQLVFGFAGAIAFLMVTFGGFKYVISQGDPSATAKAKNTILYALIGLVVCVVAFSIVTFVVKQI